MEALSNYVFFCTLTYNRASLPSLVTSTGFRISYADISDLQKMLKRLRKSKAFSRPFRYLAVTERGKEKGRPHLHILFFLPKYPSDNPRVTPLQLESLLYKSVLHEWRRNYGSTRKPDYRPLLTYKAIYKRGKLFAPYDLHYIQPTTEDVSGTNVAFYCTKYMLKPSDKETRLQQALRLNLPSDEYDKVWNTVRSRFLCSRQFGLNPSPFGDPDEVIYNHLREGIKLSELDDFPKFYNVDSGKSFPLAKYYRSKGEIYSLSDALPRYFNSSEPFIDTVPKYDDKDYSQLLRSEDDLERKRLQASERGSLDDFGDSFD